MKKTAFRFLVLIFCLLCIISPIALSENTVFEKGENYTFYCGSSSSQARQVECSIAPALVKIFLYDVRGESTVYKNIKAKELIEKYNAKILWQEDVSNIKNYYCYTTQIKNYILLNGKKVNLHIAEKKSSVAIGTPIIFGGF